jgi:Zn-dependent protease with chaperone function
MSSIPKESPDIFRLENNQLQIQKILARYYRHLFNYRLLLLLIYFIQVYIFHLPLLVKTPIGFSGLGMKEIPLVTNLIILSPFLFTFLVSYIPFYWMERIIHPAPMPMTSGWMRGLLDYLVFQIRTYFLLALLPLCVFILFFEVLYYIPSCRNLIMVYPFVEWGLSVIIVLLMYILAPFVLKYLWITEPMKEGSLRLFLRSLCYRAKVKVKDFLVWKVGERAFANALLIGFLPFNRFVIFTDTIIRKLSNEEIASVFAHEIGHAKFNHLPIYLLVVCIYLSIVSTMEEISGSVFAVGPSNFAFSAGLLIIFLLFIFSKLSHRFELQADWFARELTNDTDTFSRALVKIAHLNGIPFRTTGIASLTHPSIEKRIISIKDDSINPLQEMRKIITVLIILFAIGISGITLVFNNQIISANQRRLKLEASYLAQQAYALLNSQKETEKIQQSISYLSAAIKLDPNHSLYYILLGDAVECLKGKNNPESMRFYETAYRLNPVDPVERYYLSGKLNH